MRAIATERRLPSKNCLGTRWGGGLPSCFLMGAHTKSGLPVRAKAANWLGRLLFWDQPYDLFTETDAEPAEGEKRELQSLPEVTE